MNIEGEVKEVRKEQTFGTFTKKEIWIITEPESKYPQTVCIEFHKDDIVKLDTINSGDQVDIAVNINGRYHEGTDKVYNTLKGWRIDVKSSAVPVADKPSGDVPMDFDDNDSDLPF